jgi:hypothetical protein
VLSVEPANVLSQRSLPRDWHRQEQGIESRIVKAFAEVSSCRENDARRRVVRPEHGICRSALRWLHSAVKDDDLRTQAVELVAQYFEVIATFRQHDRRTPRGQCGPNVRDNGRVALTILRQPSVDRRHGKAAHLVARRQSKCRLAHNYPMLDAASGRLRPWVNPMSYRTALHENDRMVPITTGDGRR